MRITSLYPAATEIAFALGAGDDVVAVSHACDFPPEAKEKKKVTAARFDVDQLSSREIYSQKVEANKRFGSLFRLSETALWGARSDVLLTQGPGDFSLISLQGVRAIAEGLNPRPNLVILYPRHLDDVLDDHVRVGFEIGRMAQARELAGAFRRRLAEVESTVRGARRRRRVGFIQWLDPLYAGGYWLPQLIELAGGRDMLNTPGLSPNRVHWIDVRKADPEVLVVGCEDMDVERIRWEMNLLTDRPAWYELSAVRNGAVYIAHGDYFTRPSPRLFYGLEALAWAIHPELFKVPPKDVMLPFTG